MTAHALLSASGAKKWRTCTPSARLEETFPDEQSEFATEGTKAHDLVEIIGREVFHGVKMPDALKTPAGLAAAGYNNAMLVAARSFIASAKKITDELDAAGVTYTVLIEQRLDFSEWVPEGFGTSDLTIVSQDKVWVRDFKYGTGVAIDAEGNEQMMLYGLGAYSDLSFAYDGIESFDLGIIQPRIDNDSSWEINLTDLLAWGDETKTIAARAFAGEGDFVPGDHCSDGFCKARHNCRARAAENMARVGDLPASSVLSTQEIADLLPKLSGIAKWANGMLEWANHEAVAGLPFPGYKLVAGRSNRFIKDEKLAQIRLTANGYQAEEYMTEPKMVGITALEELVGGKKSFEELLGDIVGKPKGKPTLVPESDKRPVWVGTTSAEDDFAD